MSGFDEIGVPSVALTPARIRMGLGAFEVHHVRLDAKGQDRHLVRDGFAAVADGSTPLDRSTGGAVGQFAEDALTALHRHRYKAAAAQFQTAIAEVGGGFDDRTTPTCGVGLVQARGRDLEAVALADVMVVIKHTDGTFTVVRDNRVGYFDDRSAAAMGVLMEAGATPEEARVGINDLIKDQFDNHRNRPGGYWVFANNPAAAGEITSIRVDAATVDSVLICSDGFSRLFDLFGVFDGPGALMDAALTTPLDAMAEALRALETPEGSMRSHPRTSRYDDTTAVLLRRRGA